MRWSKRWADHVKIPRGFTLIEMLAVQANGSLRGKTLSLRPAVVEDTPLVPIAWVCGFAKEPQAMKVLGTNRTDIDKQYLPLRCLG